MSVKKGVIIGTFVAKNRILSFLEMIKYKFGIKLDRVFVYSIDTNDKEYLVTFKMALPLCMLKMDAYSQ